MKYRSAKRKVGELIFDFDFYPRGHVNNQHVGEMIEAQKAGAAFPAPVIDAKSKRIADGFHRCKMYLSVFGPEHVIEVYERNYRDDAEFFKDAMAHQASHGLRMNAHDRTRCLIIGERLGIEPEQIASALKITVDTIGELRACRIGTMRVSARSKPQQIPLKRTIQHMAGRELTEEQEAANTKLSGMNQCFYVNQIITLIESDLLDRGNEALMERLRTLGELIQSRIVATA